MPKIMNLFKLSCLLLLIAICLITVNEGNSNNLWYIFTLYKWVCDYVLFASFQRICDYFLLRQVVFYVAFFFIYPLALDVLFHLAIIVNLVLILLILRCLIQGEASLSIFENFFTHHAVFRAINQNSTLDLVKVKSPNPNVYLQISFLFLLFLIPCPNL